MIPFLDDYLQVKKTSQILSDSFHKVLITKKSCNLIEQEHFDLKLKNKKFLGYVVFAES